MPTLSAHVSAYITVTSTTSHHDSETEKQTTATIEADIDFPYLSDLAFLLWRSVVPPS